MNNKKEITITEKEIAKEMKEFNLKIDKAYEDKYGTSDYELREFTFTSNEILPIYYWAYYQSKYYDNSTEEAEEINRKIFSYLEEIILHMFMTFEIEVFDLYNLVQNHPKNEFERLYDFNKTLGLINKTRIVWEKLFNLLYLSLEREELENKVSGKKSKKKVFKNWCENNKIDFMLEPLEMLEKFDENFRTGEFHKHSKIKSMFQKDLNNNIMNYCLVLLLKLSNETMYNFIGLLFDGKTNYKFWIDTNYNGEDKIDIFDNMPDWLKKCIEDKNLDKNITIFKDWVE